MINSDDKFNLFNFAKKHKLGNADKKRGIKARYGIEYCNGDKYVGEFNDGFFSQTREGKGIYYYKNGDIYEGGWRKDKKDGKGTFCYKSGIKYEGEWRNGKRDGKGTFYYKDGIKYKGDYKNDILINGKQYYKSMPKKRKDVFLQINEHDQKKEFLSKHKDGDFIYTDDRQTGNITKPNTNYDHLKIMYADHGDLDRQLKKNIDQKNFTKYQKNNLKSVYISSLACQGGFYDSNNNNLFNIVENMMTSDSSNCVGFVSLMKEENSNVYNQTTNKNGKKGAKRCPTRKKNIENLSNQNYDKNNDFEYYCIIKENGENKIYKIPAQLCYWREYLIDTKSQKDPTKTLFDEALETLKEGKNYKFDARVILNNGKSKKTIQKITIPSVWGKNKENMVVEQEINNRNNYIANKNLKNLNIQNQLGQ